eukprot:GEMP01008194.1.p1 GENE.GEMP01008194.1~~GEMP01008194.1.p1  ORF type:complete len:635 (+),score=98.12 GEMP01008194.1:315-2219(+)
MFWGCFPFSRIMVLQMFIGLLALRSNYQLATDSKSWIVLNNLYLAMVGISYVVYNCRSEIWMLLVVYVCVNLSIEFASPASAAPLGLSGFSFAVTSYLVCVDIYVFSMIQHYDHLFQGLPVSMFMFIFLNLVWHVLLDFFDIFVMMTFASLPRDQDSLDVVAKVFTVLAISFHHQSFPRSIGRSSERKKKLLENVTMQRDKRKDKDAFLEVDLDHGQGYVRREAASSDMQASEPSKSTGQKCCRGLCQWIWFLAKLVFQIFYYPKRPAAEAEYRSVIVARKRSAVTSLLFIDTPFLFIRLFAHFHDNEPGVLPDAAGGKDFFWVKNLICIFLQSLWIHLAQRMDRNQCRGWEAQGGLKHQQAPDVVLTKADDEPAAGFDHAHVTSEEYAHVTFNELLEWSHHDLKTLATEYLSSKDTQFDYGAPPDQRRALHRHGTRARLLAADTEVHLAEDRVALSPASVPSTATFGPRSMQNTPETFPASAARPFDVFPRLTREASSWSVDIAPQNSRHTYNTSPILDRVIGRNSLVEAPKPGTTPPDGPADRLREKDDAARKQGSSCTCCGPRGRLGFGCKHTSSTTGGRTRRRVVWRFTLVLVGWSIGFCIAHNNEFRHLTIRIYTDEEIHSILGVTPPT